MKIIDRYIRFVGLPLKSYYLHFFAFLRRCGLKDERFSALRNLRMTHPGERCFIIATGPSLTVEDIEKLRGEYTFGMNSICKIYDKTSWRPSMFCIQDIDVFRTLYPLLKNEPQGVFVSDYAVKRTGYGCEFCQFPIDPFYNNYDFRYTDRLFVKFSDDAYSIVYDAYSITFSIIQIAVYMGFKEIYLLGADCNQAVGKKNHFMEIGHIETVEKLSTSAERNIFAHRAAKKYCEKMGVKVFNATRGGMLEVYPRVNLDDLLSQQSK